MHRCRFTHVFVCVSVDLHTCLHQCRFTHVFVCISGGLHTRVCFPGFCFHVHDRNQKRISTAISVHYFTQQILSSHLCCTQTCQPMSTLELTVHWSEWRRKVSAARGRSTRASSRRPTEQGTQTAWGRPKSKLCGD